MTHSEFMAGYGLTRESCDSDSYSWTMPFFSCLFCLVDTHEWNGRAVPER